jgi:hypothetical protein
MAALLPKSFKKAFAALYSDKDVLYTILHEFSITRASVAKSAFYPMAAAFTAI